ncbi:glutathione S-transferase F13-like [Punica granatum]|uniref:glutathione transferase n=2 Tax=Punica granatum TaxID=22663 RepID=A0A218VTX0_PUNGR|nr:glutathione S-transferase F13-like [Punica granatum]OWM63510.1 hypothetical protein CDL15_Pgr019459 [Punica granatum]PKI62844.1 hypothetical protein CRG98_016795 [Punica granatum]
MAQKLRLHGIPMSSCAARSMICLHEKGVEFELVLVDFFVAVEHKQPPFLSKNPFGQIPVLEDGNLTLFESRAINEYVSNKFKDQGTDLIRHDSLEESALVKVWAEVESHQFHPAIYPIFYQHLLAPLYGKSSNQAIIDEHLEKLRMVLDVYEDRLGQTKYLAGDFYSLADLHHMPMMFYFMKTPWGHVVNERPRVKAWWEDISSRDAFKKVAGGMTIGDK